MCKFPNMPIVVAHRSDGSGTTYIFTDYLSKVSPEWNSTVGKGTSVKWPVGLGGKGNEGVAGTIRQIDGSIGYVELIYAVQNNITYGVVRNKSGNFVKASLESPPPLPPLPPPTCPTTIASRSPTRMARTPTRLPASPGC